MRPLRYSINVTLDGCCDHREGVADEDLHRNAAENIARADALLFGRVTYQMMEEAWRPVAETGVRPDWMPEWMVPFARTIHAAKKYVVSSTLEQVDWNAELIRGDLRQAVEQLKQESGSGLFTGGVTLPLALRTFSGLSPRSDNGAIGLINSDVARSAASRAAAADRPADATGRHPAAAAGRARMPYACSSTRPRHRGGGRERRARHAAPAYRHPGHARRILQRGDQPARIPVPRPGFSSRGSGRTSSNRRS